MAAPFSFDAWGHAASLPDGLTAEVGIACAGLRPAERVLSCPPQGLVTFEGVLTHAPCCASSSLNPCSFAWVVRTSSHGSASACKALVRTCLRCKHCTPAGELWTPACPLAGVCDAFLLLEQTLRRSRRAGRRATTGPS